jgi:hypothetical protein
MSSGHNTEIGKCPRCHSRRCGVPGGRYCGLTDEEMDAKIAQERAKAAAKVAEEYRLIDEECDRMKQDLARRRQASEQQQAAEKKQQTAMEKAKLNEDAKKVLTKSIKECPGDGQDCVFSQLKPGEPAITDGLCMFCDPARLPKLAKTRNGKIRLKQALNAFRAKDEEIYEAAKAKLAALPADALLALDDGFGDYCPGDGINACVFSSSQPGTKKAKTKGKGTCVWCEPGKFNKVLQNTKKFASIERTLRQFKAKNKEVYDMAKERIPEGVKRLIEAAETKSRPRSAIDKSSEAALGRSIRRRLRTKMPAASCPR